MMISRLLISLRLSALQQNPAVMVIMMLVNSAMQIQSEFLSQRSMILHLCTSAMLPTGALSLQGRSICTLDYLYYLHFLTQTMHLPHPIMMAFCSSSSGTESK